MITATYISDDEDLAEAERVKVEFIEIDSNEGRHVRVTTGITDDVQVHLVENKVHVIFYDEQGEKHDHIVGKYQGIPF